MKDMHGTVQKFPVHEVWEAVRPRGNVVDWTTVIWFPHCIPRHAFHVWLIMRKRLKMQYTLRQWDVGSSTDLNLFLCPFCKLIPDSHNHVFFGCTFSARSGIWFVVWPRWTVLVQFGTLSYYGLDPWRQSGLL